MRAIVAAILYNLRNLMRFAGRDTRAQFWPYAIFLFVLQSIVSMALILPIMAKVMVKAFQFGMQHATTNGGQLTAADQKAFVQINSGIYSDMGSMMTVTTPIFAALFIILLAAAVARRLHDRGMSGYWGLMPLPFTAFSILTMPKLFAAFETHPFSYGWPPGLLINNLLYLAALILLIVLLARPGVAGANRFGPVVADWPHSP
ncbi:MAG TPA: DUF805 domain-containing protein [Stellaceae bacterium]|nr:DUF805 domain-containing protein [Stellaceae bacterium]